MFTMTEVVSLDCPASPAGFIVSRRAWRLAEQLSKASIIAESLNRSKSSAVRNERAKRRAALFRETNLVQLRHMKFLFVIWSAGYLMAVLTLLIEIIDSVAKRHGIHAKAFVGRKITSGSVHLITFVARKISFNPQ